jgi:hypothetical protein
MKVHRILSSLLLILMIASLVTIGGRSNSAVASSHREAPMIISDPEADNTDVYAFVSPDKPDTVTLIANFNPFENPGNGPNFYRFGDDILYEIHIDNVGDAQAHITYQFRFTTQIANPNTSDYNSGPIESIDSPNLTFKQFYTVTRVDNGQTTTLGQNLLEPPARVGPKTTPNYEALSNAGIYALNDGSRVFAGQADDSFFLDFSIFDMLTVRKPPGNMGGGHDSLGGFNVQTIALQVPMTRLTANGARPTAATDANAVIGIWSTTSRQTTRVLQGQGATPQQTGDWVQISRLGQPLVNESVVPMGSKDLFNNSKPADDAQFLAKVTDPELAMKLNKIYGIKVPPAPRDDLVAVFLTGVTGLTMPANVKPSEELRLNLGVPPAATPNRLGVLGGDMAGFPNGRRLADDVADIAFKAMAGAAYPLFHPDYTPDPLASQLGDGVDSNDVAFRTAFPYVALPHEGTINDPFNEPSAGSGGQQPPASGTVPGMPRTGSSDSTHLADIYGAVLAALAVLGGLMLTSGWVVRRRTSAQKIRK